MDRLSSTDADRLAVTLPVGRAPALVKGSVWAAAALLLSIITVVIYGRLNFQPTAVSNRLVDYGVAALAFPLPLAALLIGGKAVQWLLLGLWPGKLGVVADGGAVTLRLGPFGTRHYRADRLVVRYPFELADSEADSTFESFLPRDQQLDKLLPRMVHPSCQEPLELVILRFAACSEEEAATALRPVIERWRSSKTGDVSDT